ncbi:Dna2/Cas4 domain of unknown function DUF83, partial [Penicillium taxi]|uniref:Dna2/Cas4 domain of unknown function DUF83 n=1 Tax=Penicillium taxi TaxID=168475 RepID=UPI0025454F6A
EIMATNNISCPISSNSRSKLNAFLYNDQKVIPGKMNSEDETKAYVNKENQSSWLNGVVEPIKAVSNQTDPLSLAAPARESRQVKECPHTPGNRIPLADLISNAEDAFDPAPGPEVTPVDHVIWQHVPASSNPDISPDRRRKRRHSASSTSSPSNGNSKKLQKEPLDLQSIQALLKTPQHDLAAELWNNYVDKNMVDGSEEQLPPPRLANLSSSPQTPVSGKTSRDSSGLRRSVSCVTEWPTSRTKRRRQNPGPGRGIFSRANSNILDSGKKSSRINSLLEKIEKSLHPAQNNEIAPPNSSPLRHRVDVQQCRSRSPTNREDLDKNAAIQEMLRQPSVHNDGNYRMDTIQESSSDFGDDDLDQDLLVLAEATEDPFIVAPAGSHNEFESVGSSTWSNLGAKKLQSSHFKQPPTVDDNPPVQDNLNDETKTDDTDDFDDEFGDLDNFEEILAECEGKSGTIDLSIPVPTEQHAVENLGPVPANPNAGTVNKLPTNDAGESFSEDEFDDDFDLEAIEQTMKQSDEDGAYNLKGRQAIKRYQVVDLANSTYVTSKGRMQPEQVLSVEDEKTRSRKIIILRESWCDTPCSKDSFIHLVGDFDTLGQCVVDNSKNMLILHPDHLVSATVVADSIDCQRRAVLQDRVKAFGSIEKPQAFGIFFHEIFQEALKANVWDTTSLRTLVQTVIRRHIEDLYSIEMSVPEAVDEVMGKIPIVQAWADKFLHEKPRADSLVEDRNGSKLNMSITKLLEVEEHVWSPMYGLKGNIDATVQVACRDEDGEKNLVVPLELKTGKRDTNQAHRAQTALYTLLLSDRYDVDVTFGILYYIANSRTLSIRGIRHELLQMIQVRNRLVEFIRERRLLPPMLKKARMCKNCYAKTPCLIYHKLIEEGNGESSGLGDDFDIATGHLTQRDKEFFGKWDELLTKEEGNLVKFRRELWTLLSSEREILGRCFGDVVIDPRYVSEETRDTTKINRFRYTMHKRKAPANFSFLESQVSVGEPIVVSDEKGHFALANGYVLQVSRTHITIGVDRKLHKSRSRIAGFDAGTNQSFNGIMQFGTQEISPLENPYEQTVYRIDKDEFSNGMALVRNNLVCTMDKDLFQAQHLRRLIIQLQPPKFKLPSSIASDPGSLNVDQKLAIEKVMAAEDYALVLGMPGTGKTTTIAHLIRALVAQGKSVILTSYTHTAVDNILLKIRDDNIHILRIGATTKIHPEVQQFADLAATPKHTIEELKDSYEKPQVVATTCLGINHDIFNRRIFDYCIVDEASQITLPVCLGPVRMARTFILVGDHYQLPPLVQNREAQAGGLDVSLFKLLSDAQPDSVVNLEHQYRMCEEIMLLSNTLIYSGRLKCGTPEVAARSLEIPNIAALKQFHTDFSTASHPNQKACSGDGHGCCWLKDVLEPSNKTLLVNTDPLGTPALETAQGQRVVNHLEVTLCSQMVESFTACGIPARNIGVITFYRSQLSLLRQSLRHFSPELEIHTTDKFQGRDKEVVILSCVRSNAENHVGELLRDWRRVNVAFTRARTKLLVVGSRSTLRDGNELLCKYVRLVEGKGWVYNLPSEATDNHVFQSPSLDSSQMPFQSPVVKGKKSPGIEKAATARQPLSPLGSRQPRPGLKQPAKMGANLFNGKKILGNRPILQDLMNDIVG